MGLPSLDNSSWVSQSLFGKLKFLQSHIALLNEDMVVWLTTKLMV